MQMLILYLLSLMYMLSIHLLQMLASVVLNEKSWMANFWQSCT
jgi:hypothetical protein